MRTTISMAALGGAVALAVGVTAPSAQALEPTLSFGTSFGGTSVNHFTTVPSGALFDGDIITLQPGINAGVIGVLADATPLDNTCATGKFVFHAKTGAVDEVPVGTSCGLPFPYLVAAPRPAGDYAEVCGVVDVSAPGTDPANAQRTETCFRFPNDQGDTGDGAKTNAPPLLPPFNFNVNVLGFDFKHTNQFPAGVTYDGAVWALNPEWRVFTLGWLADMAPFIDANCAEGSVVFETKTGEQEVYPLANMCSNGYIYGFLSERPAKDYQSVCLSSATVGDRGERACFRFIN
ncbi:hypothetical protein H0264_36060 [Nocardia huaxiensis]|uniref:Secreted protein n=1 Tax=Nocardia huaxiensis TaxID=2755382 RepID=A0A7D6V8P2_9NOCA|nr:hypothetical protein [Nocardia huaxiensis]QLY30472.1 hypothetical protein H0264_36060 [Nocardia huaxiensis]